MRGDGRVYLRGKIWWIEYTKYGESRRESSHSSSEFAARLLLRKRLEDADLSAEVHFGADALHKPVRDTERQFVETLVHEYAQPYRSRCGLYFLLHGSQIVYVGRTTDLYQRLSRHRQDGKVFTAYTFIECAPEESLAFEAWCIRLLQPPLNTNTHGSSPAKNPFKENLKDTSRTENAGGL